MCPPSGPCLAAEKPRSYPDTGRYKEEGAAGVGEERAHSQETYAAGSHRSQLEEEHPGTEV